jgi:hypothetical protein
VADVWAEERATLMPLPPAFDGFVEHSKRVSPTCLISFERNRYSVPASFANRPVSLRVYPDRLVVAAEGNILCEHVRVIQRSHKLPPQTIYDWRHYLAVIQRKPGALRNGAPFLELPAALRQLQDHMLRKPGGDREMVDILALVLHHDEQAVLTAVEMALAAGVPTKTHVLNLLHRLVDGKVVGGPPLDTPQALILRRKPRPHRRRGVASRQRPSRFRCVFRPVFLSSIPCPALVAPCLRVSPSDTTAHLSIQALHGTLPPGFGYVSVALPTRYHLAASCQRRGS